METINILLFCPHCGEQHIDKADPNVCQDCGHSRDQHLDTGEININGNIYLGICDTFNPWLNPPHKSHRCEFCNWVWRPADVPTNGVLKLQTKGKSDKSARPRYYATAQDYDRAFN